MAIASGRLPVSRNTVVKVASDHWVSKDVLDSIEEKQLHHMLFHEEELIPTLVTPDFPTSIRNY